MVRLDTLDDPMKDECWTEFGHALASLQGNILIGHGRDNAVHLFLRFRDDKRDEVRQWIRSIAEAKRVTSALQQHQDSEAWKKDKSLSFDFCSFFLSPEGYRYLDPQLLRGFTAEFQKGMQDARARLGDSEPVVDYALFHAMVLLAHKDRPPLEKKVEDMLKELDSVADPKCPPRQEWGKVRWDKEHKRRVEHFGYPEGISQPLFFQTEVLEELARGKQQSARAWDPSAGPSLVLIQDPNGGNDDYGSYLAFRKLEQNVKGFVGALDRLAGELKLDACLAGTGVAGADLAGAFAIGRFRDGTPVVVQKTPGLLEDEQYNFSFADDPEGGRCPYHAHIRKLNPRDDASHAREHRIARRGITYEDIEGRADELPETGVGLLFMCYQRDIKRQFEFLQSRWANNTNFLRKQTGVDTIIGRTNPEHAVPQRWPKTWGAPRVEHQSFSFGNFVALQGGEYLFAPSINFLKSL